MFSITIKPHARNIASTAKLALSYAAQETVKQTFNVLNEAISTLPKLFEEPTELLGTNNDHFNDGFSN